MRKRWSKLRMPLLAMLLIASLTVSYAYAFGDDAVAAARTVTLSQPVGAARGDSAPGPAALVTPAATPPVTPAATPPVMPAATPPVMPAAAPPVMPPVMPLIAPAEELPGYVFVVGDREIVLERPSVDMDDPQGSFEDGPAAGADSRSASVAARATVAPSRLIVVDEDDHIIGIWSNTTGDKRGYYSLRTREGTSDGPEHPLTEEILAQYSRLLASVDWTICGRVY